MERIHFLDGNTQLFLTFQIFEGFLDILDVSTIRHSRHVDKLLDSRE